MDTSIAHILDLELDLDFSLALDLDLDLDLGLGLGLDLGLELDLELLTTGLGSWLCPAARPQSLDCHECMSDATHCMQADPEGFIRSLDADTGSDADNPRACGVTLLLCMLRKGAGHVVDAMLSYVAHLQVPAD